MTVSKQIMNADASSPMLIDDKTNELVYEVALGTIGEKLKQEFRLKMGQGIAGTVAQEGKPLLLEDAYTHPKFHRAHDDATGVPGPGRQRTSRKQQTTSKHTYGSCSENRNETKDHE